MSRTQVELLEHLLEDAYRGHMAHALLANISDVPDPDWRKRPAGGDRSIADIIEHVVIGKELWRDTIAGGEQRTYEAVFHDRRSAPGALAPESLRARLAVSQERIERAVSAVDDDRLDDARKTHYGAPTTVRRAIIVILEHDLYHAGEINHLRALLQADDRWDPGLTGER